MTNATAPSQTPDTSRRVLLYGGAAAAVLGALSPLAVLALPIAILVLAAVVLIVSSRSRNRIVMLVGIVASALAMVGAALWWILWGQAFDYLDAGQAVPGSVNALEIGGAAGAIVGVSLLAILWVWLAVATRRSNQNGSRTAGTSDISAAIARP